MEASKFPKKSSPCTDQSLENKNFMKSFNRVALTRTLFWEKNWIKLSIWDLVLTCLRTQPPFPSRKAALIPAGQLHRRMRAPEGRHPEQRAAAGGRIRKWNYHVGRLEMEPVTSWKLMMGYFFWGCQHEAEKLYLQTNPVFLQDDVFFPWLSMP